MGKKYLVCGACIVGNMGGAALYESFFSQVDKKDKITILSKYPKDELPVCKEKGYNAYKFNTIDMLLYGLPFFVFGSLLKLLHLPHKWMARGPLKLYYENDVLVDFSGIAFSDYRGFSDLIINMLWFFPAFVSDIPIIKISQSLGPYQKKSVHFCAKYILKRIHIVVTRGKNSYNETKMLLPKKRHIYNLPDIAMCLEQASLEQCNQILEQIGLKGKKYVVIAPSIVVDERADSEFYRKLIKKSLQKVYKITGFPVLLIPHTRGLSKALGVDNISDDLTVCNDIKNYFKSINVPVYLLQGRYDAKELKGIIAGAEFAIGSRYHFLIASMSSGVPSLALGWGYKYREMFELFDMEEFVFEYPGFEENTILAKVTELAENYLEIKKKIETKLPNIKKESKKNFYLASKLAEKSER